jgi:hypothetical protein
MMYNRLMRKIVFVICALIFTTPFILSLPPAQADTINIVDSSGPYKNIYDLRPSNYVRAAINLLLGTAGILAFLYLLLGGIQWITAGGDKDALEKARKKVIYALTGLAVTFSAYAIIFVIRALFGINLLQVVITPIESSLPVCQGTCMPPTACQIPPCSITGTSGCSGGQVCCVCP